jgi:hypothetical protein
LLNISRNYLINVLNDVENQNTINAELIKYNQELIQFILRATEPLLILKNELNKLLLICSDELKQKIDELVKLTQDYNNEVQKMMAFISPNDSNSLIQNLQTLGQNERWKMFEKLNAEILDIMRKEIGGNK